MQLRIIFTFCFTRAHFWLVFSLVSIRTPRSFSVICQVVCNIYECTVMKMTIQSKRSDLINKEEDSRYRNLKQVQGRRKDLTS